MGIKHRAGKTFSEFYSFSSLGFWWTVNRFEPPVPFTPFHYCQRHTRHSPKAFRALRVTNFFYPSTKPTVEQRHFV